MSHEFINVPEAAKLLRLNKKTLYAFIAETNPPWAIRFGRIIRISDESQRQNA